MSAQAEKAVAEADLVLLVVDVTVGVTEEDLAAARVVRRTKAPVRLVVNKVDDVGREGQVWEFVSLGLGDPWPVSAIHGRGTGDLLDEVVNVIGTGTGATDGKSASRTDTDGAAEADVPSLVADDGAPELGELVSEDGRPPRVALVGRPNVGKSTLFNRLIGEERAVVHDMPGTTRDTIDTVVVTPEGPLCFVDTAGMRRPSRTERGPEYVLGPPGARRARRRPTSRCSSSTRPSARPTRTSGWPSGSARRAARRSSSSTNGTWSRPGTGKT